MIIHSNFTYNRSESESGGAIFITQANYGVEKENVKILLKQNNFYRNMAAKYGGALVLSNGINVLLESNYFDSNAAMLGGGSIGIIKTSSDINIYDNIFIRGWAETEGGSIFVHKGDILFYIYIYISYLINI